MGDVIKSFLVGLGFEVDESSLANFNKSIQSASLKVLALYGAIQAGTAAVFASIASVSQGFEDMGYQLRIVSPAINRWLVMRQAMIDAYSKAGVNITKTVQQAILFNYSLQKTKFAIEAIYKGTASKFFPMLTKQMDIFRAKIFANMPKIQSMLTKFIQTLFKAFKGTVELGNRMWSILTRVYDFFERLHKSTNGWSTIILAVVAAWEILSATLLATPLGAIITGLVAILALFDDFEVWQQGGKSLFDWSPFIPVINAVKNVFSDLHDVLEDVFDIIGNIGLAIYQAFHGDWSGALQSIKAAFTDTFGVIKGVIDSAVDSIKILGAALTWLPTAGNWVMEHLGGGQNGAPGQNGTPGAAGQAPGGVNHALNSVASPQPLLPPSAQSTQNVSQQTSIVVNGSADAHAVGKQVAGQQDRVNFDMTRNMKGALQ